MEDFHASSPFDLQGADLRALRKARGLTLTALAERVGRSVGWLSQVERDMSSASVDDIAALARVLDVATTSLLALGGGQEAGRIVRADNRRPIGNRNPGLTEGLLSPDLTDDFEVIHSRFTPGAQLDHAVSRPTQEVGFVVAGRFDLWIDGTLFHLNAGDSFRLRGDLFRWANPYPETCEIIWVISPPVY
ncbi:MULTISPECIES: XRE family transcriptional regulator [unclassified Yoonia]|uniref:helix-turn-helix domain-containing protein n=1 Tax=unclassified Yoonia TaxID=2629118 RepID=UPI002AFEBEBF|nr:MULTISPECIES: XRE family transcriptional regulator [unclassified Yoonia]